VIERWVRDKNALSPPYVERRSSVRTFSDFDVSTKNEENYKKKIGGSFLLHSAPGRAA
jgi:hypothetical protein